MSTVPHAATILRDDDGVFYLLTRELLEQARATPEVQAEIEAALAADDTGGHSIGSVSGVPAATLLLPYFEVDLNDPSGFSLFTPRGRPTGVVATPTNTTGPAPRTRGRAP